MKKKKLTELRVTSLVTDMRSAERMTVMGGGKTRLNQCDSYYGGSNCYEYCEEPPPDQ
ncbi:hypothetical protein AB9P05_22320 [Roseivirga sp. BDSF3-8]|uniref:hypothetical protein n=1 Tax=Roseivirga sp. BDSF3-8 TaxID=3241598 RepID=UPI0035319C63